MLTLAGFGGDLWTVGNSFFWIPLVIPHFGMFSGAWLHRFLIFLHKRNNEKEASAQPQPPHAPPVALEQAKC
jgi:hypothetical protein